MWGQGRFCRNAHIVDLVVFRRKIEGSCGTIFWVQITIFIGEKVWRSFIGEKKRYKLILEIPKHEIMMLFDSNMMLLDTTI